MKKNTNVSFKLHSYLALFFGVLYLFFGISGALLVFKKKTEFFNNPPMHYCVKSSKTISLNEMYHKVSAAIGARPYYMLSSRTGHHLGFQDDSYFVKYFKKQTDISPLDFRKQSGSR